MTIVKKYTNNKKAALFWPLLDHKIIKLNYQKYFFLGIKG